MWSTLASGHILALRCRDGAYGICLPLRGTTCHNQRVSGSIRVSHRRIWTARPLLDARFARSCFVPAWAGTARAALFFKHYHTKQRRPTCILDPTFRTALAHNFADTRARVGQIVFWFSRQCKRALHGTMFGRRQSYIVGNFKTE